MTIETTAAPIAQDQQSPAEGQEAFVIQSLPDAEAISLKVMSLAAGVLAFCLLLSWVAPKVSAFKQLLHWMGGH